jgi:broad specificity phosphatase PhoE
MLAGMPGATLIFSHAATSRVLAARFLGLAPQMACAFSFDPAHLGVLGYRSKPALLLWNDGSHLPVACKCDQEIPAPAH